MIQNNFNVNPVSFKNKYEVIKKSDIIITATSAPHYIIKKNNLENLGFNKELLIIDLAVPRDVEESVDELNNVSLFNIEDIFEISQSNAEKRIETSLKYAYLINDQIDICIDWFKRKKKLCRK